MIYDPYLTTLVVFSLWSTLIVFQVQTKRKSMLWLLYFPWIFTFALLLILAAVINYASLILVRLANAVDRLIPSK